MNSPRIIFLFLSATVWFVMAGIFLNLALSKNREKIFYMLPIGMAMLTLPIYLVFMSARTYTIAMLFDGLYFACTDWLCFFMMLYVYVYIGRKRRLKGIIYSLAPLVVIDTVSLIINVRTQHSFNLEWTKALSNGFYWSCTFKRLHYVHLGLCYIMVLTTIIRLGEKAVKAPYSYKKNFFGILAAFLVVIVVNIFCYVHNLPVDFSVLLYPLLAAFIYCFALYSIPYHLLRQSLSNVNENINDAILYFNINKDCIYKNTKAEGLFSVNGQFSENMAIELFLKHKGCAPKENARHPVEYFYVNGAERQFEIECENIFYGYSHIGSYLKLTDKTDEIEKFLEQKFLTIHDGLTGAYNREHFFELCDKRIKKSPGEKNLMMATNIRQFKLLNEIFGEETGDQILIRMVTTAKTFTLHDSLIGRIGDDRFALFCKKEFFKESLINVFLDSAQEVLGNSMYKINLCVGICETQGTEESAQVLYDKAQLSIKKLGDDYQKHFAYYDSDLMDELLREKQIVTEFESALKSGQIHMYLQPIMDSQERVTGCEALARWNNPDHGLLLPEVFIPVLERTGLIHKLDTYIWEEAAKKLSQWRKEGEENIEIFVNVSSKDIFYIDIADSFKQLLLKYEFDPKNLKIEFTESALPNNLKDAVTLFEKLKKMGFCIGIDDFGHGYSSLNFLKDINADFLKMDMVLLQKTENEKRAKIILSFISQISHALGMHLISEGVETAGQFAFLTQLGCPYFQGFYFSQPFTVDEFEDRYLH